MRTVCVVKEELLKNTRTVIPLCGGTWEGRDLTRLEDVHILAGREKNSICVPQHFYFLPGVVVQTWADTQCYNVWA